jgi:hypothetical protein
VQLQEEAVQLRLRQRVGALVLDRVLRGDDDERLGQRSGLALDGDLALLHRLEQRRLRLRGRAVDLVSQQQVGEHRPLAEAELAGRAGSSGLREDQLAEDVGGHQVRRELHAREVQRQRARQGLGEQRLGDAGDALQQDVPTDEEGGDEPREGALLPDDDLADLLAHGEHGRSRIRRGSRCVQRRTSSWTAATARATATSSSSDVTG